MKKPPVSRTPLPRTTAKSKKKQPVAILPAYPTAMEIRRSERATVQSYLDAFHSTDSASAKQRMGESFGQNTAAALKKLASMGRQAEVESYLRLLASAQQQDNLVLRKDLFLRGYSLRTLCRYLEQGEKVLFSDLPVCFHVDTDFFLQEPWIREVITQWREQGEVGKIENAFAGVRKGNKGRSFKLAMENLQRDKKIVAAVRQLLQEECGYNEAMRQVSKNFGSLGIGNRLSPVAIRKIYEAWTRPGGLPSFVRFFIRL